jgi:hypothetical protein
MWIISIRCRRTRFCICFWWENVCIRICCWWFKKLMVIVCCSCWCDFIMLQSFIYWFLPTKIIWNCSNFVSTLLMKSSMCGDNLQTVWNGFFKMDFNIEVDQCLLFTIQVFINLNIHRSPGRSLRQPYDRLRTVNHPFGMGRITVVRRRVVYGEKRTSFTLKPMP